MVVSSVAFFELPSFDLLLSRYLLKMCIRDSISTGDYAVTLQSNINYLKAGHLSDQLKIEGLCVHNGKTTKVVEVVVTNQEEKILRCV